MRSEEMTKRVDQVKGYDYKGKSEEVQKKSTEFAKEHQKEIVVGLVTFIASSFFYIIIIIAVSARKSHDATANVTPQTPPSPTAFNGFDFITDEFKARERRFQFMQGVDKSNIQEKTRFYSELPHIAGSQRNNFLAEVAAKDFASYGFDKVTKHVIPVLLANLTHRSVNVTDAASGAIKYRCSLEEKNLINQSDWAAALLPSNGYGGDGEASGPVVWVNYGREEDFERIKHVNLTGTIVVVRYGKIFRANKAKLAQDRGAVGVIIANDPYDVGYMQGPVFPKGPWANNVTTQRGSVFPGEGDPLTPNWPSERDGPVLREEQLFHPSADMNNWPLLRIPVQPMGYGDAFKVLSDLSGEAFPSGDPSWNTTGFKALFQNGIGPGTQNIVKMEVRRKLQTYNITNVIATLYGSVETDRSVFIGSHRDAWTYGAADPISGHSTIQEIARNIGEMHKTQGWRPRRNIQVCSWDAEEWAIIGSIEYVETTVELLRQRAVAYLNLDVACTGSQSIHVDGSPSFASLLKEAASEVELPDNRGTADSILKPLGPKGSGSDHIGFIQQSGVPVIDGGMFNDTNPLTGEPTDAYESVYHSNYDSFYWMQNFGDPDFKYHGVMAKLYGNVLLRLAESNLIPLSALDYATAVKGWVQNYADGAKDTLPGASFEYLQNAAVMFRDASAWHQDRVTALNRTITEALSASSLASGGTARASASVSAFELRALNDASMGLERVFLGSSKAETGQDWYKHVLFTPSAVDSYGAVVMPIIANALATKDVAKSEFAIKRVGQFVKRASVYVNSSAVLPWSN